MTEVFLGIAIDTRSPSVYFRTHFVPAGYGCLDKSGSLKPVPPGETKLSMGYCAQCEPGKAGRCLFPTYSYHPVYRRSELCYESLEAKRTRERMTGRERTRWLRSQGKGSKGKPLPRSCWNCAEVRRRETGYVCGLTPDEEIRSMNWMSSCRGGAGQERAEGCVSFCLRTEMEVEWLGS